MTMERDNASELSLGHGSAVEADRYEELNARFQKKFAEIKREKEEILSELERLKGERQTDAQKLEARERVFNVAVDKGLDPKVAMDLIIGEGDLADRVEKLADFQMGTRLEERQAFAAKYGRTPRDAMKPRNVSYEQLLKMPDEQIKRLPDATIERAISSAGNKEKLTLRDRLRGVKK